MNWSRCDAIFVTLLNLHIIAINKYWPNYTNWSNNDSRCAHCQPFRCSQRCIFDWALTQAPISRVCWIRLWNANRTQVTGNIWLGSVYVSPVLRYVMLDSDYGANVVYLQCLPPFLTQGELVCIHTHGAKSDVQYKIFKPRHSLGRHSRSFAEYHFISRCLWNIATWPKPRQFVFLDFSTLVRAVMWQQKCKWIWIAAYLFRFPDRHWLIDNERRKRGNCPVWIA